MARAKNKPSLDSGENNEASQENEHLKDEPKIVKARVLIDCAYGKCNDVISFPEDIANSLIGMIDTDPAAVSYAESLQ